MPGFHIEEHKYKTKANISDKLMYADDQCQTMPLFKIRDFQKHGPRQSSHTCIHSEDGHGNFTF